MKKVIFAVLLMIGVSFHSATVFATGEGKHPPKAKNASNEVFEVSVINLDVYALTYESLEQEYLKNAMSDCDNLLSDEVSMLRGDAAIPIRAQASYLYSKRKPVFKTDIDPSWDYNLNRYWC